MLERILPASVAVAASREDSGGPVPYPEEEAAVGRAVEKRRREFVTARACARQALSQLGLPPQPIPAGQRGEPLWPAGVVGSITHCAGYRASAVGREVEFATIGIDAELDEPLPEGLLPDIALPEERLWIDRFEEELPGVCWDRLLFSVKESIYKAWFPLARSWLGFEDASVTIDPAGGTFSAHLLVPGPTLHGGRLDGFSGNWLAAGGLVLSAIALPAQQRIAGSRF